MIEFIFYYWKQGLIVVLGLSCGILFASWKSTEADFRNYKTQIANAVAAQDKHADEVEANYKRITEDLQNEHQKSIDDLRAYYANRMRTSNGSGQVSRLPDPPRSIDAVPTDALPIAGQCAETTQQLIDLQKWVSESFQAGK